MECQQLIAERTRQERMAASVSDQMYSDCQELLQLFGIPWIVAPSEAEAQCAFLDAHGLSNGTITDDSDIWVFGGKSVFKNFFDQDRHCEQFVCEEIARHFGLTREKMVLLAILTGSDYTDGIESVGPVTALEILAEFSGVGLDPLKQFRAWWDQFHNEKLPPGSKSREAFRKLKLPQSM
jgi:DNA excision repair protein ERCC-5